MSNEEHRRPGEPSGHEDKGREAGAPSPNPPEEGDATSMEPAVDEREKERQDRDYWKDWLGNDFSNDLGHIRQSVSQLFEDHKCSPPLRGFTPHDASHCHGVEDLIHRLIPGRCYRGLREYERFLLLASAWLHDIGMIRGLFEEPDKTRSDGEIRATHHERSEKFIVNHPARCGVHERDAAVLGVLARLHCASLDDVPERLNVGNENVRVRLLAAYLCVADALHIDSARAPADLYAICLAYNEPPDTKIHWIKSRFVSGIEINARTRQIVLQFKVPSQTQKKELQRQGVEIERIGRIHDVVVWETTRNLDAVKTELLKWGISYFLTVERQTVPMLLDEQVLRDLKQIINNPDFMANPSSSRLSQLMLRTVADILNLDDRCEPIESNVSESERIAQRARVLGVLRDIEDRVLAERECHLDLKELVEQLRKKTKDAIAALNAEKPTSGSPSPGTDRHPAPDPLETYIREEMQNREEMRRRVRVTGKWYFQHFVKCLPTGGASDSDQTKIPTLDQLPKKPITVLLFGYSELVIKALCGFRDVVLASFLQEYVGCYGKWSTQDSDGAHCSAANSATDEFKSSFRRPFHLAKLERHASNYFRLFVCAGEPKTQMNSAGQLSFHDGSQYVEALCDHGFTNIELVTDIAAAGNLLHRAVNGKGTIDKDLLKDPQDPMVDLVLLGVNGIEGDRFRHGTGHLGISAAVASLSSIYGGPGDKQRFRRLPRLVFVATQLKYQDPCSLPKTGNGQGEDTRRWTWLDTASVEREGYWIQKGFCGEAVREKVFLIRDPKMQHAFHENGIRLYNPREEDAWAALVDDLIMDEGYFYGTDRQVDKDGAGIRQKDGRKGTQYVWKNDGTIAKKDPVDISDLKNFCKRAKTQGTRRREAARERATVVKHVREQIGEAPWDQIAQAICDALVENYDRALTLLRLVDFVVERGFQRKDLLTVVEKLAVKPSVSLKRAFIFKKRVTNDHVTLKEVADMLRKSLSGQEDERKAWEAWAKEINVVWEGVGLGNTDQQGEK